jgi:hypothetical protein
MATVGLSLLREVTEKVNPPPTLLVPFPMGHPLGRPNDPALQYRVIRAALNLLSSDEPLPILCDFPPQDAEP